MLVHTKCLEETILIQFNKGNRNIFMIYKNKILESKEN